MLPRLRRRRLLRWVAFTIASLVLFAGAIWLALALAGSSPTRAVRVLRGPSPAPAPYSVNEREGTVRIKQEVAPGEEREFELKSTAEGVLVRPLPPKQ